MLTRPVEVSTAEPAAVASYVGKHAAPTGIETILGAVLAEVVQVDRVPIKSHFFDDLGANSLVMAHFCARVRKRADLPAVSMKDVYRNPTIRSLATSLSDAGPPPSDQSAPESVASPTSTREYVVCGSLQLLYLLGYAFLAALVGVRGYEWISGGSGALDVYLRSVLYGAAVFVCLCTLPIVAKWLLVGRWKRRQIRVWSLEYVRFWIVKTLVRTNPLVLFVGSPLYVVYLRALGARVGRGAAVFSRNVPVCTDLLTLGAGTVIRKDASFTCYRARAGVIHTGAVTVGRDVVVGEATVIDIETSLGDGAQLGHASALVTGQVVPPGECWSGSPAQPSAVDRRTVEATPCGTVRRASYTVVQLLTVLLVTLPLVIGVLSALLPLTPLSTLLSSGGTALTSWTAYRDALVTSSVLFFGPLLFGLVFVGTVPRLLNTAIQPDTVYRLYGVHYSIHRTIARTTNLRFFLQLFGDSSYIVHYLRYLGYDLSHVEQTGSNFGTAVKHDTPYLTAVGRGTMVADGLSVVNADFSSTSFRLSRVSIGPHNFLGNNVVYPAQGRTGDNCLLATKVMVPVDGVVREGTGLLGSPSFNIPRSVQRDRSFDHVTSGDGLQRRLAAKNRYNLRTMGVFLLLRWMHVFGVTVLAMLAAAFYGRFGLVAVAVDTLLVLGFSFAYFALIERGVARFRALRPQLCSIYDPYFWWHERFWKHVVPARFDALLSGTPFKNVTSRLLGARVGRRVFDDGCHLTERTLVSIGDECTLNAGSVIQCHSQEDGTFKSDRTSIGDGCTLGVGAFVHYGVMIGDGAELGPDSFLMKGEEVPRHATWVGNPARETRATRTSVLPTRGAPA